MPRQLLQRHPEQNLSISSTASVRLIRHEAVEPSLKFSLAELELWSILALPKPTSRHEVTSGQSSTLWMFALSTRPAGIIIACIDG
jgi:hypothetical protein